VNTEYVDVEQYGFFVEEWQGLCGVLEIEESMA
jgi:hypothetical protein